MEWGVNLFRSLFAAIDGVIYTLIAIVYEILIQISKINIFGDGALKEVAEKFYTLLGIFMLFKVTFSFITFLVNPDQLTERGKGAQRIILNILLVLAMIMITPFAFDKLYEAQDAILQDHVIPKLILGQDDESIGSREYLMSDVCPNTNVAETDGDYISLMVFRPFYQIDENISENTKNAYCAAGGTMSVSRYLNLNISEPGSNILQTLITVANPTFGSIFSGSGGGSYSVDYKFFASTIVGVVVLLVLVSFCFDIAVRTIKIGFLQIIAPIPIISYIDPKSGKDGMFKKWIREVGKTWADLFVRLAALYFAVYVIKLLDFVKMFDAVEKYKFWVMLFFVIGALIFAKKLPKLIEEILGIKLGGELTLNPMKKIRDNALGGKYITGALKGAAALGVGSIMGGAANIAALRSAVKNDGAKKVYGTENPSWRTSVAAYAKTALGGAASSAIHGAQGALKNDSFKKGVKGGLKVAVDNRDKRDKEQNAGYQVGTKIMDRGRALAGIKTEAKKRSEKAQSDVSRYQALQSNISFRQQALMDGLDIATQSKLTNITVKVKEDSTGQKHRIYSITDDRGKEIEIGNEQELESKLQSNEYGSVFDIDKAKKWVDLQAEKNALDKQIFTAMKTQKTFAEKDVEANKPK